MSARSLEELITRLQNDSEREPIASEIQVLQSIYGEDAVSIWKSDKPQSSSASKDTVRLDVRVALPSPHEAVQFNLLVSIPSSYPTSTPPQLQILSRYIGSFQVDSALFGAALKTYISNGRVKFTPGEVAIFDGIENVKEAVVAFYEERLSAGLAAELHREEERNQATMPSKHDDQPNASPEDESRSVSDRSATELPEGVHIWTAQPIVDRKSTFVGRACQITHPSQVPRILAFLLNDKSIARATHPTINAWRCEVNGMIHQDNDDDGETAAGGRLAHLLQILDVKNVLVIVTRYYGGIMLHGDRFRHINAVARAALDEGGFLDIPDDPKRAGRTGAKGKHKV